MKKIFLLLALGMVTNHFLTAQSMLHIGSGGSVYTTNPGFITLKNAKLVNNGIFSAIGGNFLINGNAPTDDTTIEGSGTTDFDKLTMDKSSNGLKLNQNIRVNGTLQFVKGLIYTNGNNIRCGATLGANSTSYIVTN